MILNWPQGFGVVQGLMVGSANATESPDYIFSQDFVSDWVGKTEPSEDKTIELLLMLSTGEILLDKLKTNAVESSGDGEHHDLYEKMIDIRAKHDMLNYYVFMVELRGLWPLLTTGKSWAALLESGWCSLDGEATNFFVETAVESMQPTQLTYAIMEYHKNEAAE